MVYRYSLQEIGVPIDGPAPMFRNNNSVVLDTPRPTSILKNNYNTCAYHHVWEAIATGIAKFTHIPSKANCADILIESLSSADFNELVKPLLFCIL